MSYQDTYNQWVERATDEETKKQLDSMKTDLPRMEYAFYKSLAFGTAGIRGIMDAGTNCLNVHTIAATSEGVAQYLVGIGAKSVVISYDSRINSTRFAYIAANVLISKGIRAIVTSDIMPVAFVSFCVRHLGCDAGIFITASHNSKEYNGYKVFNNHGIQLDIETASIVAEKISKVDFFAFDEQTLQGKSDKIEYISDDVYDEYLKCVYSQSQRKIDDGISVVYTALNGAGYKIVPQVLTYSGLTKLEKVLSQSYPDGEFLTCPFPNPEKPQTLQIGIEKMLGVNADLLIATDPDCDRVGVVVNNNGKPIHLSGNEVGILLCDYLLAGRKQNNTLPAHPVVVNSIVSTRLVNKIVADYNGECAGVLTGFKYIGDFISKLEEENRLNDFILGFEESCGYLVGTHARDKDAVVVCMLIVEMASYYKKHNVNLYQKLMQLYAQYGRYYEKTLQLTFSGASGDHLRAQSMSKLRSSKVLSIANLKVTKIIDLSTENDTGLPFADVIIFTCEKDSSIIVRPSGTEPLIKLYISCGCSQEEAPKYFEDIYNCFLQFFGYNK